VILQGTPPPPGVDPNFLISQIVPLIGVIAVAVVAGVVLYAFFKSDLAAAIAERIRSKIRRKGMTDTGQITEMAERLDFAERLLAQKRERSLPGA
jgi:hypothetical protein